MQAFVIDPRGQTWEDDSLAYRVHFWRGSAHSEEWQLSEADVDEVLAWADANAEGRSMSVWVIQADENGVGLIRLAGGLTFGTLVDVAEMGVAALTAARDLSSPPLHAGRDCHSTRSAAAAPYDQADDECGHNRHAEYQRTQLHERDREQVHVTYLDVSHEQRLCLGGARYQPEGLERSLRGRTADP